ncbi:DUF4394 domain-containing protein [Hymenobacter koreensis]|uniref:DUF4394 domain-containing protein n=1 Tax=Hymenobacter koreensis TaxID=1084523 RepID=A0ABP8J1J0_9BACT
MNTVVPITTTSGFWRRTFGVLAVACLGLGAATSAQAQTVYGLSGSDLTSVNLAAPFTSQTRQPIVGLPAGRILVGLDFRPATGQLYALGYTPNAAGLNARLYILSQNTTDATATATPVGTTDILLNFGAGNERIGFDFNPTVDRIRVVGTNDVNYRLNPNDGSITATDTNLAFVAGDANAGQDPFVGAAGYTNSFIGSTSTTLYYIDEQRSLLLRSDNPNGGSLATVATITPVAGGNPTPINAPGASTDLDIYTVSAGAENAYLNVNQVSGGSFVSLLYRMDLTTGATTLAGAVNGTGVGITDIAVRIDRTAPAPSGQLLYAVNTNNTLVSFYSGTPGFINSAVTLSGVTAGQTIVGTDFRPNTGELFGLGYNPTNGQSRLYTINLTTGVATPVGAGPVTLNLGNTADASNAIGFDFNPTVDRIRVTGINQSNYRLNPNDGSFITDGSLNFAVGATGSPTIGAVAYTNSYAGSTSTTLYDIDDSRNQLFIQTNPNAGELTPAGAPGLIPNYNNVNVVTDLDFYFDAAAQTNRGFVVTNADNFAPGASQAASRLYTLNPMTGVTLVGSVGQGVLVRDVAAFVAPLSQPTLVGRLLYGVAGNTLISFDSGNPTNVRSAVNISGLGTGLTLVGTDFRPANGLLYALGYNAATQQGQLYTLNVATGALSTVGGLQGMPLGTTAANIGFDFNPVPDRIRITSASTQANLRMNPVDATFITDGTLSNPSGTPALSGVAYINNDNNANTGTALFGYDQTRNVLLRSTDANAGTYVDQGTTGISVNPGVEFDVYSDITNPAVPVNTGFLVASPAGGSTDNLYTVDLTSGAANLVGRVGSGSTLTGLAAFLTPGPVITAGLTWTGAVSTDWGTAGNWLPTQVPSATDNVTIPNVANDPVVSNAQQANNVTLASSATLTTANGGTLTVNGNFTNNGGTTLGAGTGTVAFNGTSAHTISGTTTFFNNLTAGPAGVRAAAPVQVQRVLLLNGSLASNGNLTLLSNAAGTAHVVNVDTARVRGSVTVQRYIDPSQNSGPGYRHYSSPVSGSTVGDLATAGFAPVVNPAYNSAPVPNNVTPFPTVFGYDEQRVTTSGNPAPLDFDQGFFSPNTLNDPLVVGRGYTVNIPASETVDFVGTLNNGPIIAGGLTRGSQTESGWHLLGNPYPSPIDWDLVGRSNVDAAVYVYRSTGQYAGTYSSYVAGGTGTNGGTAQIAVAQGFFVRVSLTPATVIPQVSFSNAARLTTYANPTFQRGASTAPLVRLDVRGATGPADEAVVYFDATATAGFDSLLDAYKLVAGNGPLLSTELASGQPLSINALPALAAADVAVNLRVQAAQPGTYTLRAAELLRLPAGTVAYLRDAQTGAVVNLTTQPSYSFALAAGAPATGRFSLLLSQRQVLATAPASLGQQVAVYPNPARAQVAIGLPTQLSKQPVELTLVNTLGQVTLRRTLPAARTADAHTVSLAGVAPGVYTLRLQTAHGVVNKRLVVE